MFALALTVSEMLKFQIFTLKKYVKVIESNSAKKLWKTNTWTSRSVPEGTVAATAVSVPEGTVAATGDDFVKFCYVLLQVLWRDFAGWPVLLLIK